MWPFKRNPVQCKQCLQYEATLVAARKLNMDFEEGKPFHAEAHFEGVAVKVWAASMVQWFRETGGKNYIVVDMSDPVTGERYSLTMQRANGRTPAQDLTEMRERLSDNGESHD